jgi:hypothetical protein
VQSGWAERRPNYLSPPTRNLGRKEHQEQRETLKPTREDGQPPLAGRDALEEVFFSATGGLRVCNLENRMTQETDRNGFFGL